MVKPTQTNLPNDQKASKDYPVKDNPKMEAGIPPKMTNDQKQKTR